MEVGDKYNSDNNNNYTIWNYNTRACIGARAISVCLCNRRHNQPINQSINNNIACTLIFGDLDCVFDKALLRMFIFLTVKMTLKITQVRTIVCATLPYFINTNGIPISFVSLFNFPICAITEHFIWKINSLVESDS